MPRLTSGKPTREQLQAAYGESIPDLIAPGLRMLFIGINPSLYSAAVGHHFARPGNRFWPALHGAGFTDRLLAPAEERLLLEHGYGITNLVDEATARADELTHEDLVGAASALGGRSSVVARDGWPFSASRRINWRSIDSRRQSVRRRPNSAARACGCCQIPADSTRHYQLPGLVRLFRELRLRSHPAPRRKGPSDDKGSD